VRDGGREKKTKQPIGFVVWLVCFLKTTFTFIYFVRVHVCVCVRVCESEDSFPELALFFYLILEMALRLGCS
jgi:hypothetical protein